LERNHRQSSAECAQSEKEALKEISLEIIKSDLQKFLQQVHQKQREELEKRIATIEERCAQEIRDGIDSHLHRQLTEYFQKVVQSCQSDIYTAMSPLLKRAEQDISNLNNTVRTINTLCHEIQEKYSFRWEKPFLLLFGGAILTGAIMGVLLFLLQTSPVAVFLMNGEARKVYDAGLYWLDLEKRILADEALKAQKASQSVKAEQKPSKLQKKKKLQ
jgi:hypothetical protein